MAPFQQDTRKALHLPPSSISVDETSFFYPLSHPYLYLASSSPPPPSAPSSPYAGGESSPHTPRPPPVFPPPTPWFRFQAQGRVLPQGPPSRPAPRAACVLPVVGSPHSVFATRVLEEQWEKPVLY